jgi:hypothetical protein
MALCRQSRRHFRSQLHGWASANEESRRNEEHVTVVRTALFCVVLSLCTALLSACAGGSVAAPVAATTTPSIVSVPSFTATTVPVTNPASGAPLTVTIPVSGGTASLTFPAGTTVAPGTTITVKAIDVSGFLGTQSKLRRTAAGVSPLTPSHVSPGLYVQVTDGLINVTNNGGTQNFAAGQFGFVPSALPPVIVPKNPGLVFVPPPPFVPTYVAPVGNNKVGPAYPATTDPTGAISFPLLIDGNAPSILALGPASMFASTTTFAVTSTTEQKAQSTMTLDLPAIAGGFTAAVALHGVVADAASTLTGTLSLNAPANVPAVKAHLRSRASIGGTFNAVAYATLSSRLGLSSSGSPAFTFTFPGTIAVPTGRAFYVALLDPANLANGWNAFLGPGIVSGQTVTFSGAGIHTEFAAGKVYAYALISTVQTLSVPTAAPSSTPSPTPSPSPSPTPFVATLATAATPGPFNILPVPPILPGLTASSLFVYSQTVTSATQNVTVSASTGNFANLAVPPGQTPVLFLTVSFSSGPSLTFDAASLQLNLAGTLFAPGTTYNMTPTLSGVALETGSVVASPDDHPGDTGGGSLGFATPLQGFTLVANQQVGIVISH